MHLTKQQLGEGYLLSVSVTFATILLAMIVSESSTGIIWKLFSLFPVALLVVFVFWLRRLDLTGTQIWRIAQFGAYGIGLAVALLIGSHLIAETLTVSSQLTAILTAMLALVTLSSALLGVTLQLRSVCQQFRLRNAVLYRLLRHNLRNDMTVVITHLDDIKEDVDEPQRQKLEIAEQKITDLVELTDKVRQINATLENGAHPSSTVNLASLVNCRVAALREEYPCATIDLDVPGTASVYADEKFGLVIDNIVESAVTYGKSPSISISISGHGNEIRLQIDDRNGSIPNSDLAAIENGIETALEHGYGMELWLVYWLVEHTGGTLTIETDGVGNRITITLQRVREVVIDY